MSVYVSTPVTSLQTADSDFKSRGIAGRRVAPTLSGIFAVNYLVALGLPEIHRHLYLHVMATALNQTLLSNQVKPSTFSISLLPDMDISLPKSIFAFESPLSNETMKTHGLRPYKGSGNKKLYVNYHPSMETIRKISVVPGQAKGYQAPTGFGSLTACRVISLMRRVFRALAVNVPVPGERTPAVFQTLCDEYVDTIFVKKDIEVPDTAATAGSTSEKRKTRFGGSTEDVAMEGVTRKQKGWVYSAAPSTRKSPFEPFPNIAGITFPYFPRMIQKDVAVILRVISAYCGPIFSDTPESFAAFLSKLSTDLDKACSTTQGLHLSHMAFGIELAISSSCGISFVCHNKQYLGFVLQGRDFRVLSGERVVGPLGYSDLLERVAEMSVHERSLKEICEILGGIAVEEDERTDDTDENGLEEITDNDVEFYRLVQREIYRRLYNISDDDKARLNALGDRLSFGDEAQATELSVENFATLCKNIKNDDIPPWSTVAFHHPGRLCCLDIISLNLSQFGVLVPSVNFPGEKRVYISTGGSDPFFKRSEVIRMVDGKAVKEMKDDFSALYIQRRQPALAVADWESVLANGYLAHPRELSRKDASSHTVLTGDLKKQYWKALQVFAKAETKKRAEEISGSKVDGEIIVYPKTSDADIYDF